MTFVEILVALGVLAIAFGGVLAIFGAASRQSLAAQERSEAARVAQAVFDLAQSGAYARSDGALVWGRNAAGKVEKTGQIQSVDLDPETGTLVPGPLPLPPLPVQASAVARVVQGPLSLRWTAQISDVGAYAGLSGMYSLSIVVFMEDREVARLGALLTDRTSP